MPTYHIYLLASLPMLQFQGQVPFSFEEFLRRCDGLIGEKDIAFLRRASGPQGCEGAQAIPVLKRWHSFECGLRNELAKVRAQKKGLDAHQYIRQDGGADFSVVSVVRRALKTVSPIEAEKMLDEARWHYLDELALGHYFDQEILFTYALKLLINIRWQNIKDADPSECIEQTITAPQAAAQ